MLYEVITPLVLGALCDDYSDSIPPEAQFNGLRIEENEIHINLSADTSACRVDVELNDRVCAPVFTGGFDDIIVPFSVLVITSYSIHYTKLYDCILPE